MKVSEGEEDEDEEEEEEEAPGTAGSLGVAEAALLCAD